VKERHGRRPKTRDADRERKKVRLRREKLGERERKKSRNPDTTLRVKKMNLPWPEPERARKEKKGKDGNRKQTNVPFNYLEGTGTGGGTTPDEQRTSRADNAIGEIFHNVKTKRSKNIITKERSKNAVWKGEIWRTE